MRIRALVSALATLGFLGSVVVLACGGGNDGDGPPPTDSGSEVSDGPPGDSDLDGSPDAPDSVAPGDCSCGRNVSGTRLKRINQVLTGSDGSRSTESRLWYD